MQSTRATLISYFRLLRIANAFTVVSNIGAAHVIATAGRPQWASLVLTIVASLCLYHGGMILNDCFDVEEDRRERPDRPLPAGSIPLSHAWVLGFGLLLAGAATAALVGVQSLLVALILCALILLYNGFAKRSLLGPLVMGMCRFSNWLLGMSVIPLALGHAFVAFPVFLYVTGLTLLSREETTAARKMPLFASILAIAAAAVFVASLVPGYDLHFLMVCILIGCGMLIIGRAVRNTLRDYTPGNIQNLIGLLISGIIPLDAMITFAKGYEFAALFILMLVIPGRWAAKRFYLT